MTVFKGYMKLWRRNIGMTIMYFAIFMSMTLFSQMAVTRTQESGYAKEAVDIAVIDEDGSTLAKELRAYLDSIHHIEEVGGSKREIQEALYYRRIVYVVRIPNGFGKDFVNGNAKLQTTILPGSNAAMYVDSQIDTYLNGVRVYLAGGFSPEEAAERMLETEAIKAEVTMIDKNGNAGKREGYVYMLQFFPFMILSILGFTASGVLMQFREKEVKNRMYCAPVSVMRQNLEVVAAFVTVGILVWAAMVVTLLARFGGRFLAGPNKWYYMGNTLLMTLTALALSLLVGLTCRSRNALTAIVNTVSLGMCFLCGVYVPLEVMGDKLKMVSQFLPVYWYEVINDQLARFGDLTSSMQAGIWKGFAIQFAFSIACIFVSLLLSRKTERE